ncbi:DUF1963 domain-containing protein [Saccharothrix coeruleofusca]|uniref:DUF1963 domain-containing protein n=1 Tax=Saccharothrix coeruleofusca TaxID=33919 RepID=A0A918AUB6_9PSEU|nr:DUF1963 domain-containing protein [Saccharothrix coeruleofusca]GGP86875.1 hypothetical protein GCM10010185_70810 [Saccharothrix coeruleofusca]
MIDDLQTELDELRATAIEEGFAAEEVDRWLAATRTCLILDHEGDGPVAGRFGGPPLLPADTPTPDHPLVATIDLAALPPGTTGLDLPTDGQLLLFASPWYLTDFDNVGAVVHVPAGAAVEERDRYGWRWSDDEEYREQFAEFSQGPFRAIPALSLSPHDAYNISDELGEFWEEHADIGMLQLGGYGTESGISPYDLVTEIAESAVHAVKAGRWEGPVSEKETDWVLLADWHAGITGLEGAVIHWGIQRDDLAARRFDRAYATLYWNP